MTSSYAQPLEKLRSLGFNEDLPENWSVKKARWLFETVDERSVNGQEDLLSVSEHKGVIHRKDINVTMFMAESYEGYKLCDRGDLVINSLWAWSRGLGFSDYRGIISTAYSVYRLRDQEENDYHFLNYLLRTNLYVGQYSIRSKGIWISRLQLSDYSFLDIPILLPPKQTQERIVAYLGTKLAKVDKFITNKQLYIEKLHERKQAIINHAVTKGLDPNVKTKPSGIEWLGDVPIDWGIFTLKNLVRFNPTRSSSRYETEPNNNVVFLPMEAVETDGSYDPSILKQCSEVSSGYTYFEEGDVLVAKITPCFENGKGAFLKNLPTKIGYGTTEFHVMRPDHNKILGEYLYLYTMTHYFRTIGTAFMTGSAGQQRISANFVKNFPIALPPLDTQREILKHINDEVSIISKAVKKARQQIDLIKEYRDSLITHAVTGQIKIKE